MKTVGGMARRYCSRFSSGCPEFDSLHRHYYG